MKKLLAILVAALLIPFGAIAQVDYSAPLISGKASTTTGKVQLLNSTNANTVTLQPGATGTSYTWTLPTADSAGPLQSNGAGTLSVGGGGQLRTSQTTPPSCTANCGVTAAVSGTDTSAIVTMGSTGSPASGFVISFNGTWPAQPSCVMQMAKSGMVSVKAPIVVVATTTTMTVTTNGSAPSNGDLYAYVCVGIQ